MFVYFLLSLVSILIVFHECINSETVVYKVNTLHPDDYEKYNKNFSFNEGIDSFLINRQLPIIKSIQIQNKLFTSDFLLNTGSVQTWVASAYCTDCTWSKKRYTTMYNKKSIEHSFIYYYGIVSGFFYSDNFLIKVEDIKFNLDFVPIIDTDIMNTQFKFTGMIGLGVSSEKTLSYSFPQKIFQTLNITKTLGIKLEEKNEKLFFGDVPQDYKQNLTNCSQIDNELYPMSNNYWGCKMDYILIGQEYDFYLTKKIDQYVLFDSLSYFHVAPYDLLEYFMDGYFYSNDKCATMPIDSNNTIYRIECHDETGLQRFKSLNIIINGWAYRLGSKSLFDTEDVIFNTSNKNNYYYFKVLFSRNRSGWTLGTSFFKKFFTAFNYETKTLYFSGPDRVNFTKYTRENMQEDNSVFILFLSIIGIFLLIIIILLLTIFHIKQKRILISYELNQKFSKKSM
jgi:hypothetical protein